MRGGVRERGGKLLRAVADLAPEGMRARPAVARAFAEESALYLRELQRHGEPLPVLRQTA